MDISTAKSSKTVVAEAPGRINIIGEHTDYNDGFVLPAAIDKKLSLRLKLNGTDSEVNLTANDLNEQYTFDLKDFHPVSLGWPNYAMGVVHELQKIGANLSGFDAGFNSDIPIGSGISSSAALECSFAVALNHLFDVDFDNWQLIKASQLAEHNFAGIKCGIMDQFASMMGKKEKAMLRGCRSLDFQYFPLQMGEYRLLLLNTNVSHSLASSEYNTRRAECEEGIAILQKANEGIKNLRDVSLGSVLAARNSLPKHIFKRCHHVVSENQRVMAATNALLEENYVLLGDLMYQSHYSLQNDYEVSCPELNFLVEKTLSKGYILGSRMMGGGFGGCTINIIENKMIDEFWDEVSTQYKGHFGIDLSPIEVAIGDGARVI